ncbi:hypothetical protein KIPB_002410 [Kipferlia bialata]|uniref:Uncharacterized protein n=1 Tax=Kipferlia bialata TaxID=797122 RepID=A0A9K3GG77_9EUKA|nr:hypothetical protein KIPB_002410 [Kipferlia bialata]|eukprot:g2410.t1
MPSSHLLVAYTSVSVFSWADTPANTSKHLAIFTVFTQARLNIEPLERIHTYGIPILITVGAGVAAFNNTLHLWQAYLLSRDSIAELTKELPESQALAIPIMFVPNAARVIVYPTIVAILFAILLAEFDLAEVYYTTTFAAIGIALAILLGTATYFGLRWFLSRERPEPEEAPSPSPEQHGPQDMAEEQGDRWTMQMNVGL